MIDPTEIKGLYEVQFTIERAVRNIDVEKLIVDMHGHPIFVIAVDGTWYNWINIVSIKEKKGL